MFRAGKQEATGKQKRNAHDSSRGFDAGSVADDDGDMRALLAFVLITGCSGTAGVRDHAEPVVVATHCRQHACPVTPHARGLGAGCYVVEDRLYQCSNDGLPLGEVSCFEIDWHAGTWEFHFIDSRGHEISTRECRDRWREDHAARR
jgi:hypothetical protein